MEQLFSSATRRANLTTLASETVDLLVIGGGITGAGIAREAAMRGIRTAVLDGADFAAGTSSRSSRLVHGGLRYLEHGQLRLVFEASRERRVLLRIAPHLVRPLPFLLPVHRASRVGLTKLAAGMWLYDLLALFRNVRRHRILGKRGVRRIAPTLRDHDLVGGALYYDAQCDDARLVMATIRSAHRHGALAANYGAITALDKAGGRVHGARVRDVLSGAVTSVRAHVVVNATGPWTDIVRRLDDPGARPVLRPTKGAHVAVPRHRLGNSMAITLTSPLDGRVMFVIPWGELAVIGTTDTDYDGPRDGPVADGDDVTYLLRSANAYFPQARLTTRDVVSTWAGLRPLLTNGGAAPTAAVSREHRLLESRSGLLTIAGGKLTTYRAMAVQVVDRVAARLRDLDGRRVPRRSGSDRERLPGGEAADLEPLRRDVEADGIAPEVALHLVARYGTEAAAVANLVTRDRRLGEPLLAGWPVLRAEVVHQARREMALTVADVLMRRTDLFRSHPSHAVEAAPEVSELLAGELGWDLDRQADAVGDYLMAVQVMRGAFTREAPSS